MLKKQVILILIIILSPILISWGDIGHSMISLRMELSFNEEMTPFTEWLDYLSEHSSDADWRKKDDPSEGPKHYIDIDNYESFINEGKIPHSLESCIIEYGSNFVKDNGYLPWATIASYDSVVINMKRGDFRNAAKYLADLSHYVADGHMPLHITRNYNGQFSGNTGIHARYEIYMIDRFKDEIQYTGYPAKQIDDVENYIFSYIYENYSFVNPLLKADDYAFQQANDNSSDLYFETLWSQTEELTEEMFSKASHSIAELLYTAWIEAGRPLITALSASDTKTVSNHEKVSVFPNPVKYEAVISYNGICSEDFSFKLFDISGKTTLIPEISYNYFPDNKYYLSTADLENGSYFLVLEDQKTRLAEQILIAK